MYLFNNFIYNEGAGYLADVKVNTTMTDLYIGSNSIGKEYLVDAFKVNSKLTNLGSKDNSIENEDMNEIEMHLKEIRKFSKSWKNQGNY